MVELNLFWWFYGIIRILIIWNIYNLLKGIVYLFFFLDKDLFMIRDWLLINIYNFWECKNKY